MEQYDIAFLGGGLASSMVSRFLKLRNPNLKIIVLEKASAARWSPGESTVGVTGLFLIRDLGLSTYCYLNHLPKNGLRYFFRESGTEYNIETASEVGSNVLPAIPTFQIDRKRITEDLWQMNRSIGVDLRTSSAVTGITVNKGGNHLIQFESEGKECEINAEWIIHGAGRSSAIAPQFNELSKYIADPDHQTAAAWGRYSNVADIDSYGSEAWKQSVGFTSRYLSTNHFMGKGYWIWIIPIDRGIVSFGLVYDKEIIDEDFTGSDAFNQFIRSEPFVEYLLRDARQEDFQSFGHLAFRREQFCSTDKWALIGDTHEFVDPFYSPGSDSIARQAYMVEHLIQSKDDALREVCEALNGYAHYEYELLKALYCKQYHGFGSFEVFNIKSLWDFFSYTNRLIYFFYAKKYESLQWIKDEVEGQERTLGIVRSIQKAIVGLSRHLESNGDYERKNRGEYSLRQNRFRIEEEMLRGTYTDEYSSEQHLALCKLTISELVELRFGLTQFKERKVIQEHLYPHIMERFELNETWLVQFLNRLSKRVAKMISMEKGEKLDLTIKIEDIEKQKLDVSGISKEAEEYLQSIWSEMEPNQVEMQLFK